MTPEDHDAVRDDARDDVLGKLLAFARTELAPGAAPGGIGPATPLHASGILKSLETARLLAYLRQEFGVRVPPSGLARKNFENLERVTDLVLGLLAEGRR
ncbi:acyl carrier protein [Streptomyces roseoverticillatus]|uniref:acyl carrier protein n=1 Tax=Streptomyces roseoverticillatus TaxID=66429 RepID=UPI0033C20EBD